MFSLKLTKGLRESRVFVYVQCFPPKVFMIQLLSMIPRQCFISMTIQEVSSWHPGHTKSIQIQTFPNLWGIFCYSLWQKDILKKKTTSKVFMVVFFFASTLSLSLLLPVSCVRIYINTAHAYHISTTVSSYLHFNTFWETDGVFTVGDFTEAVGISETVRILTEPPTVRILTEPPSQRLLGRSGFFWGSGRVAGSTTEQ